MKQNESGFTLIEVLVALLILSLAMGAILETINTAIRLRQKSGEGNLLRFWPRVNWKQLWLEKNGPRRVTSSPHGICTIGGFGVKPKETASSYGPCVLPGGSEMERKFIDSPRPGWNRINLSQGFTLLEVICSLLIAGLVVLTVLSIVNQSYGLWQRSWSWGEEDRGIRLVARTLEDFCANIFGGKLPKGEKEGFVGEPFEFSGLLEGEKGLARAGMRWDAQEKAIYYRRETDKGLREKVNCEKVAEAEFSYISTGNVAVGQRVGQNRPLYRLLFACVVRRRKRPCRRLLCLSRTAVGSLHREVKMMPERGAITLLVLWAVLIISAMALAIGYNLEMDALLTRQFREEAQSRQDARAIFWWIVHKLQTDTDDVDTRTNGCLPKKIGVLIWERSRVSALFWTREAGLISTLLQKSCCIIYFPCMKLKKPYRSSWTGVIPMTIPGLGVWTAPTITGKESRLSKSETDLFPCPKRYGRFATGKRFGDGCSRILQCGDLPTPPLWRAMF